MISLKNVDFIYNNAQADIGVHQIDLEISKGEVVLLCGKGQILRSTPNTAPLICGAYNTQPEGLLTTA